MDKKEMRKITQKMSDLWMTLYTNKDQVWTWPFTEDKEPVEQ